MTSQSDVTWFYDVTIGNSVFQLGFLTREFQIPIKSEYYLKVGLKFKG